MDTNELLLGLQTQIAELRKSVEKIQLPKNISDKWLPRSQVMAFLNYGSTQMAALEKSTEIIVTKVGKRKFILKESIEKMLESNIITNASNHRK